MPTDIVFKATVIEENGGAFVLAATRVRYCNIAAGELLQDIQGLAKITVKYAYDAEDGMV
jgi:hypothetical protein